MKPLRFKKLVITFSVLLSLSIILAITNPTKEDYIKFDESKIGIPIPKNDVQITEADFLIFSVYAISPKNTTDEFGIVHLGFMGNFYKVTDGQYDDSIWKNILN